MDWYLDSVNFRDYGITVLQANGLFDSPPIQEDVHSWLDSDYTQINPVYDPPINDSTIELVCLMKAATFSSFNQKLNDFFAVIRAEGKRNLFTPFSGSVIEVYNMKRIEVSKLTVWNDNIHVGKFVLSLEVSGNKKFQAIDNYSYLSNEVYCQLLMGKDATFETNFMGVKTFTFTCETTEKQSVYQNDYIYFEGEKFIHFSPVRFKKYSTNKYVYSFKYESECNRLSKVLFLDLDGNATFDRFANPTEIITTIVDCVNSEFAGLFAVGTIDAKSSKNHSPSNENCLAFLDRVCKGYNLEYKFRFDSGVYYIDAQTTVGTNHLFALAYGANNGLYTLEREEINMDELVTKLYVFGGTKNLPQSYTGTRLRCDTNPLENNASVYGKIQKAIDFDEIYPRRTGHVTAYTFVENTTDPNRSQYIVEDSSFDFNMNDYLSGIPPKITFNSGDLAGYTFEINYFDNTNKLMFITPVKDERGIILPNATIHPSSATVNDDLSVGDKYVVTEILIPSTYQEAAQIEVAAAGQAHLLIYSVPKMSFNATIDPYFRAEFYPANFGVPFPLLTEGDTIHITDADFGVDITANYRILTLKKKIYTGEWEINIADKRLISKFKSVTSKINDLAYIVNKPNTDAVTLKRATIEQTGNLKTALISPVDDKLITEKLRPENIDPMFLSLDAGTLQFHITGLLFEQDGTVALQYNYTAGTLVHHSYNAKTRQEIENMGRASYDPTRTWNISASNKTVGAAAVTNVYVKVPTEAGQTNGTIEISTATIQEKRYAGYLYFLIGTIDNTGATPQIDMIFGNVKVVPMSSFVGMIEDIVFDYRDITAGTAQTYVLIPSARFACTIEAVALETDNGTLTGVAVKIGATAVTSLSSLTVDTGMDNTASTGAKTVAIGDRVTLVTSTGYSGTPTSILGTLKILRT